MGTYCEIKRELIEEDFNKDRKVQIWRNANVEAKLPKINFTEPISTTNAKLHSKIATIFKNPFFSTPASAFQMSSQPTKLKKLEFKEKKSPCQLDPCMNDAKCELDEVDSSFKCICKNSSFSGKYCENYQIQSRNSIQQSSSSIKTSTITNLKPLTASIPMISFASSAETKKNTTIDHLPYYTRAFFWQCPSNCLFNLGRGFCTLSTSGYPRCSCHEQWAGVDCGQKNYCFNNECQNNSTCSNYPEMR
jgi:hypothetical protein